MSLLEKCEEFFGTNDFYSVLKIDRTADPNTVKKAYHKASLLVHPDRVPESEKLHATEKFKVVSYVYSILSDAEKRSIYDETGSYDEETDDYSTLITMWRNLFPKITVETIEKCKQNYIDSEQERRDILKAYLGTKGNMTKMHDMIPFMCVADEERIIQIVRQMVDAGEAEEFEGFFNESKAKKARRKRKEESNKLSEEEVAELMKEHEKRKQEADSRFANFVNNLQKKYGKPNKKPKAVGKVSNGRVTKRNTAKK